MRKSRLAVFWAGGATVEVEAILEKTRQRGRSVAGTLGTKELSQSAVVAKGLHQPGHVRVSGDFEGTEKLGSFDFLGDSARLRSPAQSSPNFPSQTWLGPQGDTLRTHTAHPQPEDPVASPARFET